MSIRIVRWLLGAMACLFAAVAGVWAVGAFAFDFPSAFLRKPISILLALALVTVAVWVRGKWRKLGAVALAFLLVLGWWLTLQPSNDRPWQKDVEKTAWAAIDGDTVTLHNVRNCDYRTETDYTPRWETRTVRLSQITGLDIAINYWGSPWMAHPILSFQFADSPPLCFSIETRKEVGETYSAIGGFYRQYELIYIVADERDVLRVRTNYRKGEDVYLYHTTVSPDDARGRFLDYVKTLNELRDRPRWYNAATTNCTTSIRSQHALASRAAWDWRMLLNGKMDEMLFENHVLDAHGLPFEELKRRSLANARAQAAGDSRDFSKLLREGMPK